MPSPLKKIHTQTFTAGLNSDLAREMMPTDISRYMLNCNVLSTEDGNMGVVTNVKGTINILVPLHSGLNKCIGKALDEEKNNLYFFVYNSEGYHGIFRYNKVDNAVIKVMECITDTGGIDIFRWQERDLILQANIIGNNLLYWCVRGEERHPPRKINISKALDRSPTGYNGSIKEEYTRAYKRTSAYPPRAEYFTDPDRKYNRVYGRLFKFATRYVYDDGELSNWSSFSSVPTPDFERFSGSLAVPLDNNGIHVHINTGGFLVKKIEIAMMCTNTEGGTMPWVSVETIDKIKLGIGDFSEYTYDFYNDSSTEAIGDQQKVYRAYSYLPKDPVCQEFTDNALVYANFHEGFPDVQVDVDASVRYEDLFIPSDEEPELNSPSINVINTSTDWRSDGALFGSGWRALAGTLVIGPDVKKGNIFTFTLYDSKKGVRYTQSITATISDTAKTIATKFANKFREYLAYENVNIEGFEYVREIETDLAGNAFFEWKYWNTKGSPHLGWSTSVNRVNTNSLKNAGQSVQNIKLGSSVGYAIVYFDEDGRKSAAYRDYDMTVAISSINELGGLKKPVVSLTINHIPPDWAVYYQIVRTDDLVYGNYIQMLIQKTVDYNDGSDEYIDLVVGSLFTYQRMHPNATLTYEFKKGDRVRLIKQYDGENWVIPAESNDFEILAYYPTTEDVKDEDIEVDGTSTVTVSTASPDNIGSFIRVNGAEREIIGAPTATTYDLNEPLSSGDPSNETKKFPSYTIINYRGILRIKSDPDNPISADPNTDSYPLVEIYSPSIGDASADEDMYSEFGQVYPILGYGTGSPYHGGSTQDQSLSQPAIVEISAGTSYVRYRELPINNDPENPQVLISEIEDGSYSDFYVSDMNDNGKRIPLDKGDGEVLFDERVRFSNNYIEGTRINGLNDFDNTDRVDYNDKYGAIELIWYEDGRMYIFKHLKDAWVPVYASIITDQNDNPLLAKSDKLLADKLQYFAFDGGVGDNPESITKHGTQFFHISPNAMIAARIGGNGVDAISKIYGFNKDTRDLITSAKKAGAHIYGGADIRNDKWDVSIETHDNVISDTPISEAGWENDVEQLPSSGVTYSIVSSPSHGTLDTSDSEVPIYTPDTGYSGPDTFSYEVFVDGVSQGIRNICLTIVYQAGPPAWRPIGQVCILDDGNRTGYQGWTTLEEYDSYHGNATGNTKPNVPSDPDYVAPVYNTASCAPQESFVLFNTTSTDAVFTFDIDSGSTSIIVEARSGSTVLDTSSSSSSISKQLDLSGNAGAATILVRGPVGANTSILRVISNSNSVTSENIVEFPNVYWMEFRDGLLTELSVNNVDNIALEYIIYEGNSVESFNPSGFTNLFNISAGFNGITSLPSITDVPDLEEISYLGNGLTTIDTSNMPLLRTAELQINSLTQAGFNFSVNPALRSLYLADNPGITSFAAANTPDLVALTLDQTGITSLNTALMPDLQALDITQTPIAAFSISSNDELVDLRCGECTFTSDTADPAIVDAVIIKMNQNIVSGGTLHYDTLTPLGIQPTNASRAAYDSMVVKGTNLQGKVPLP